ncbi:MAG: hypothetical protein L6R38_006478 [Xanthoria sp. 2 TBL-2021]|nr:MAG: hypothetical protein L6R38_006478 [Xanthoria sp. 2 TBL-2021]
MATGNNEIASSAVCARCHQANVSVTVRNEHLCQDCFTKYVVTKVTKRLESNKLRAAFNEAPRLFLLPLSLGSSSVALLHILHQQLEHQENRTGRRSFRLHLLFVDQSAAAQQPAFAQVWRSLKEHFPSHSSSIVELEDVFNYDSDSVLNLSPLYAESASDSHSPNRDYLENFLSGLPSATSRADMIGIIRTQLVDAFAKKTCCDSILYGDSTTRLAERTLSETAKGRGGAVPWLTGDGQSPRGIKIVYPMRDLLRKEITAYTAMTTPPLTPFLLENTIGKKPSASSKNITIEDLMGQYFESVEQNYPSIVANVVRTSGRLVAPSLGSQDDAVCHICRLPLTVGAEGLRWNGEQEGSASTTCSNGSRDMPKLCFGCARSTLNP